MKVSVLLLTYNEASNLPRCLAALKGYDDIVVVDSGSSDDTVEIVRRAGARVLFRPFDNFSNQRNFGLKEGAPRNEWVLHLDADEVLTPEFRRRLDQLVAQEGVDAYRVPSKIMMSEHWLRYAGMYPAYQVRLGHRDRLRFKEIGHGQREDLPEARLGTFDEPYLHYNFSQGLAAWLRRHVKYAEAEAQQIVELRKGLSSITSEDFRSGTGRRRLAKDLSARLPLILRPLARFVYVLFWRRGFLDGRYGVLYALMLSVYEGMTAILVAEEEMRAAASRVNEKSCGQAPEDSAADVFASHDPAPAKSREAP